MLGLRTGYRPISASSRSPGPSHVLEATGDCLIKQRMGLGYEFLGFDSAKDYGQALRRIPKDGARRVLQRQSAGKPYYRLKH